MYLFGLITCCPWRSLIIMCLDVGCLLVVLQIVLQQKWFCTCLRISLACAYCLWIYSSMCADDVCLFGCACVSICATESYLATESSDSVT